jgi:Spy/CpxP family protein refolding chaperone
MNRKLVCLSAFAAVMMMACIVSAQDRPRQGGPGRMGMMGGGGRILRNEAVQKELNITDEQKKKLEEVLSAGGRGPGGGRNFQDMSDDEKAKAREEMEKRSAEQEKKINEILNDKQQARYKQLRLQAAGAMAFMGEDLQKELGITEEQQGKIRDAMRELRESMQGAQSGERSGMGEKMNAKVMEILTDEQKAKYKTLIGEPFDVTQLRPAGPGGPRRGGN